MIQVFNSTPQCAGLSDFVKSNHYLKSLSRGNKVCFVLREGDVIVGAALFGYPVGTKVVDKYGANTLELKRFVMLDGKNNRCSQFLGKCLRYIKRHKLCDRVISYADPEQGHEGVIYKASNFKYLGTQKYSTPFVIYGKKKVYARNVYSNSERGLVIRRLIKKGLVSVQYAEPKHIYMYDFNRDSCHGRFLEGAAH